MFQEYQFGVLNWGSELAYDKDLSPEMDVNGVALNPIVSRRLYQQVAERIKQQIQTGNISAGDRLPAEKDLALQLGVSRPVVREALIALEIAGLVEIRTGSGTYVRDRARLSLPMVDAGPGPFELLHARLLIEGEVAAEAAIRATESDLAAIEGTVHDMERIMAAGAHAREADQAFHVLIANVAGNSVLADLVARLWHGMFSPMFHKLSDLTGHMANQERTLAEHKAIFAALSTHDPVGARAAMRRHLKTVETVLSRSNLAELNTKHPTKPK
jgi:DNA-binding FadR family transcriptional regulator